jgi:hypothetical protein
MIVAQPAATFGDVKMENRWTTTSWEPEALIDVEELDRELQSWPGTALTPAEKRYYNSFKTSDPHILHTPWGDETIEPGLTTWIRTEYGLKVKKHGVRRATAWLWWEVRTITGQLYLKGSSEHGHKPIITPSLSHRGEDSWGRLTSSGDRVL